MKGMNTMQLSSGQGHCTAPTKEFFDYPMLFVAEFGYAMARQGLTTKDNIIADSQIHRFHVDGDTKGTKNGWYTLYANEPFSGAFGCHKRGVHEKWTLKNGNTLTREERITINRRNEETRIKREQETQKKNAKSALLAQTIWNSAGNAVDHPYAVRKGISCENLRVARWSQRNVENALLIPVYNTKGQLVNLQAIFPTIHEDLGRDKDFLFEGEKKGCWHTIGEIVDDSKIIICEGWATGMSIHMATGHSVAVAFDAPNLPKTAQVVKKKYPTATVVLAQDHDDAGREACRKARQLTGGTIIETGMSEKGSDFNDLQMAKGLEAVKMCFEEKLHQITPQEQEYSTETDNDCDELLSRIKQAKNKSEIEKKICMDARKMDLSIIDQAQVAQAVRDKIKDITGADIGRTASYFMIARQFTPEDAPDWCRSMRYIASKEFYFDMSNRKAHSTKNLNILYTHKVPMSVKGERMAAEKFMATHGFVKTVDTLGYFPQFADESILNFKGTTYANLFDPQSIPKAHPSEFTEKGARAIDLIEGHISILSNGDKKIAKNLIQWLAHNVQHMGKLIRWSPIIQSIEGMGKGFIGKLLEACLGIENVGRVSPNQACSKFNGWATNKCVNILEELKLSGFNKYDVVNAIKPFITDETISVEEKNIPSYNTHNSTNYICFTNHKDAVPLSDNDRRWMPVFVKFNSKEEFSEYLGYDESLYFDELFKCLKENASEIRKWLLEYPISEEFMSMNEAPMTDAKRSMIVTEQATTVGFVESQIVLDETEEKPQGKLFHKECLSSADFFDTLFSYAPHLRDEMHDREKNALLRRLGYTMHPAYRIKIKGKTRIIWVKDTSWTNDQVRASFENANID